MTYLLTATQATKNGKNEWTFKVPCDNRKRLERLAGILCAKYYVDIIDYSIKDDCPIIWSNY